MTSLIHYALCLVAVGWLSQGFWIYLILQDKILFCAFEAGDIVCWLVNLPIAKQDLFKSADCRWMCKTYAEFCYRNSATVRRLVQSPTLQTTILCGVPAIYVVKVYEYHPLDWALLLAKQGMNCNKMKLCMGWKSVRKKKEVNGEFWW